MKKIGLLCLSLLIPIAVMSVCCRSGPSSAVLAEKEDIPAAASGSRSARSQPGATAKQEWPGITGGHYLRWVGRVWNTRKPAKIWDSDGIGTLGQRNGTATYLGEDKVDGGIVEFEVKFDAGYLAPEGGGKHFMEIMSWVADRSDRQEVGREPWSRIELARLGDRPRCVVWNYGAHFSGEATKIFPIGPAFEADRWYHIRFDWVYKGPAGQVTIHVDERSYSERFEFVPGTIGPGRFYLFGHVETDQPDGRMHFRNFQVRTRK